MYAAVYVYSYYIHVHAHIHVRTFLRKLTILVSHMKYYHEAKHLPSIPSTIRRRYSGWFIQCQRKNDRLCMHVDQSWTSTYGDRAGITIQNAIKTITSVRSMFYTQVYSNKSTQSTDLISVIEIIKVKFYSQTNTGTQFLMKYQIWVNEFLRIALDCRLYFSTVHCIMQFV